MIPVFHTEFDALQLSLQNFPEIPPYGDFGDFWWLLWLFSVRDPAGFFGFCPLSNLHTSGYKTYGVSVLVLAPESWNQLYLDVRTKDRDYFFIFSVSRLYSNFSGSSIFSFRYSMYVQFTMGNCILSRETDARMGVECQIMKLLN